MGICAPVFAHPLAVEFAGDVAGLAGIQAHRELEVLGAQACVDDAAAQRKAFFSAVAESVAQLRVAEAGMQRGRQRCVAAALGTGPQSDGAFVIDVGRKACGQRAQRQHLGVELRQQVRAIERHSTTQSLGGAPIEAGRFQVEFVCGHCQL